MLRAVVFWHVWSLQASLATCEEHATGPAAETFRPADRPLTSAVRRIFVPEDHYLCLRCAASDRPGALWTREDRETLVTLSGAGGRRRYRVLPDGVLCLLQLDDSDDGAYRCDGRLVAELQVLTGHDFAVSAGWTLLLPCSPPYKARQRWFHRRTGGRREPIFTRFRNGTVRPEREGGRLSYGSDALQIQNLQLEDAGEYQCGERQVRVAVMAASSPSAPPEPTSLPPPARATASAAVTETDGNEMKKDKKRLENALLLVAAVGLGTTILLLAAVCVLLTSVECRRRKKGRTTAQGPGDTELQPWTAASRHTEYEVLESPPLPEETIHYASLGRRDWAERPSRSPPGKDHHGVIYSSVITRPGVRETLSRTSPPRRDEGCD